MTPLLFNSFEGLYGLYTNSSQLCHMFSLRWSTIARRDEKAANLLTGAIKEYTCPWWYGMVWHCWEVWGLKWNFHLGQGAISPEVRWPENIKRRSSLGPSPNFVRRGQVECKPTSPRPLHWAIRICDFSRDGWLKGFKVSAVYTENIKKCIFCTSLAFCQGHY